jgi:hypothetical protein
MKNLSNKVDSIENKSWREFAINELFEVSGSFTTHPSKLIKGGKTPRITCSSTSNGLDELYLNKATEEGGVITIDSATVGHVSYQEKDFIATDHVEKVFINERKINRNLGLGLTTSIRVSTLDKFNYGYKFSQKRIKKQKIILPVDMDQEPDYGFIEQYSKSIIDKKIENYKKYAEEILSNIEYKEIDSVESKEWQEFFLTDVFPIIQRGKRLTKGNQIFGDMPYVSSTASNNGIDNYIGNKGNVRIFSNCLSIANSGSVGASFYHHYRFVGSDHITHLKREGMSKYIYLFISTLANRLSGKYNFNREINDKRISREKIMLPVNKNEEPDYEYMEQYMKNMIYNKLKQYLNYSESRHQAL